MAILNAQAVCLEGKVYFRGTTILDKRADARLYIYTPATDTWETMDTPVYGFALTTYHSQLVLVGGREYAGENVDGRPSNKLWTLRGDGLWHDILIPMETEWHFGAAAASHGDHLLVAVGSDVIMYDGGCWRKGQHLPAKLSLINSAVHNSRWYLMGANGAYFASIGSLIATCQSSMTSSAVWHKLPDVPDVPGERYSLANFQTKIIAVGWRAMYVYLPYTRSWSQVGDVPGAYYVPCAVALASDELMIIKDKGAFKGTLKSMCKYMACISLPQAFICLL